MSLSRARAVLLLVCMTALSPVVGQEPRAEQKPAGARLGLPKDGALRFEP